MNQKSKNEDGRARRGSGSGQGGGNRSGNRQQRPGGQQAAGQDRQSKKRNRPRGGQSRGPNPQGDSAQSAGRQGERSERRRHRRPRDRDRGHTASQTQQQAKNGERQPRTHHLPADSAAANQPGKDRARRDRQRNTKRRIWLEARDRETTPWFTARAEGGRPLRFTVLFGSKAWDPLVKTPPRELTGGTWDHSVQLEQTHGSQVHLVGSPAHAGTFPREGDALVTRAPGLALTIATADCVPVMLADRRGTTVAAVHAGWRGIAAGLPGKTVQRMSEAFQIQAGRFLAFIGPSISCQGYRVDDEVVRKVAASLPENGMEGVLHREADGPHLDLEAAVRIQLLAAGLHERSIFGGLPSTDGPEGLFHSHRQSGGTAGRMHSMIYLHAVEEEEPPAEEKGPEFQELEESTGRPPDMQRRPSRRVR